MKSEEKPKPVDEVEALSSFENSSLTYCFANSAIQLIFAAARGSKFEDLLKGQSLLEVEFAKILTKMKASEKIISTARLVDLLNWGKRQHCSAEFIDELLAKLSENFQDLFNVVNNEGASLSSLLLTNFDENEMEEALRKMFSRNILCLPRNVIVHINRVEENGLSRRNLPFHFPANLDLGKILVNDSMLFEAKALICQEGSAVSGHYVAYVKSGNNWIVCNDSTLSAVAESKVFSDETFGGDGFVATLIFYCMCLFIEQRVKL